MSGHIIASIPKNNRERVSVHLDEFRNSILVNVRIWALNLSGEWVPTPKGVALKPELLPPLIVALQAAADHFNLKPND